MSAPVLGKGYVLFSVREDPPKILQRSEKLIEESVVVPKDELVVLAQKSGGFYQCVWEGRVPEKSSINLEHLWKLKSTWCHVKEIPLKETGSHALLFFFRKSGTQYSHTSVRRVGVSKGLRSAHVVGLASGTWKILLVKQFEKAGKIEFEAVDEAIFELEENDLIDQNSEGFELQWNSSDLDRVGSASLLHSALKLNAQLKELEPDNKGQE